MIKDILVHLRGTKTDEAVLGWALELARLFDAHLECVTIAPLTVPLLPPQVDGQMETAELVAEALDVLEADINSRAEAAHDAYAKVCLENRLIAADTPPGPPSPNASWRRIDGEPTESLIALTRFHDLVVTAGGEQDTAMASTDVGRLIAGSGKPVLLAPPTSPRAGANQKRP